VEARGLQSAGFVLNVPGMSQSNKALTLDDVRHVAKLARLSLTDAKLATLTSQLEAILGYIAKLSEVDVSGVEPMAHALPLHNVLRDDTVEPSLPLEKVLMNAPETDGPFFKVPKVIGGDEDSAG
jgi:aspartyl-tRNA(Asn)/glutamyl-tRNA(Gln) amidotransferase subunit C